MKRGLVAMLVFRNEMRFLPDWFRNVTPHVDGVVAVDHNSTDGSSEFVAGQSSVLELIRLPPSDQWSDGARHQLASEMARWHRAEWAIGLDADERLEQGFRERADRELARADRDGIDSFYVSLREVWDRPDRWRSDGIWAGKGRATMFRCRPGWEFDPAPLHQVWAPLPAIPGVPVARRRVVHEWADLLIYHLRMLRPADRQKRADLYRRLDPDRKWQKIGYDYLVDESGLELSGFPPGRGYEPLPSDVLPTHGG